MAVDYASRGIRVNAVGAGSINTPFLTRYLEGLDDPAAGEATIKGAHPIGRWAEPREIADAILYLAGSSVSFITGHILMMVDIVRDSVYGATKRSHQVCGK
ncbi:SDR family oxidoreductase [Mesorhizobium sp. M1A.F.Ca.IN.020.06.1.1]|uniref:SDR family oxidoreductase n=1 Tax=unclassified Mesorhizobium TaxID=325217 RepID=UPI000FCA8EFE|nr:MULTISPECIES: SDR family oxidoreductase [unclassified Mesorhizobium]RUV82792.1 SDR family oxidoreductase [Mesorhizobium sp. M1A.F.Ca.IN.020.32.1.1]RUW02704.1 SDR family oxidoreductase [Mesorhizobium sp. M1A.F.Ca.IN.022.05.2.1]RUW30128.1 SDR family oxidoreductase [Mesorhizobium sp. M1A.F.Ca.IN.020.06.1.1]RWF84971.1 MAG: SDR family oxidoreductase [Mesorhizobium sp.]RWG07024.1 MAG: SDR family oxidoreductase [Mesorhizobium sp.]